eukprot:1726085-Prymnesium_polylepis.1
MVEAHPHARSAATCDTLQGDARAQLRSRRRQLKRRLARGERLHEDGADLVLNLHHRGAVNQALEALVRQVQREAQYVRACCRRRPAHFRRAACEPHTEATHGVRAIGLVIVARGRGVLKHHREAEVACVDEGAVPREEGDGVEKVRSVRRVLAVGASKLLESAAAERARRDVTEVASPPLAGRRLADLGQHDLDRLDALPKHGRPVPIKDGSETDLSGGRVELGKRWER